MATLIKVAKNGNKTYRGIVKCERCGGLGGADKWAFTGWTCYECGGSGTVEGTWIEYSEKYLAQLEARRKAREAQHEAEQKAKEAELEAQRAKEEAERIAREEKEAQRKAISQYVGTVGDKIDEVLIFDHTAYWEQRSYSGYGVETVYLHAFRDSKGNLLVWKTGKSLSWLEDADKDIWASYEEGDKVRVKATIKEHKEYKDEKQTVLTRCRVEYIKEA